jgi:hypothetical protein
MMWGRRRDSDLRLRLQVLESRIRLAQAALFDFREHFMPAAMAMPIIEASELLMDLERAENILAGIGEGGAR